MGGKKEAPAETPIVENEYVKELLVLLKENQSPAGKELLEAIGHVSEAEKQFTDAIGELKAMRQELQDLREQNHPLKAALQKSVKALEANMATLRGRPAELKGAVIEGCKNTLAAVKERGVGALDNAAWFFYIKPGLESLRNIINDGIKADEKAISRIKAVNVEYHEAGRHLKSIGRAPMGKETVQEAKTVSKLVKTVQAPYRVERAYYLVVRNSLNKAVSSLERLEKAAEKQPSILKAMKEHKETPPSEKGKSTPAAAHDERQTSGQLGPRFFVSPWPAPS